MTLISSRDRPIWGKSICRAVVAVASSHSNHRSTDPIRVSAVSRIASAFAAPNTIAARSRPTPFMPGKKWREANADYQKAYRLSHEAAVERNRQLQRQRDGKRRVQSLVKNNLALDLKRSTAGVWLIGPAVRDLDRNNLASCQLLIVQPLAPAATLTAAS
jgi:hypothetical protein